MLVNLTTKDDDKVICGPLAFIQMTYFLMFILLVVLILQNLMNALAVKNADSMESGVTDTEAHSMKPHEGVLTHSQARLHEPLPDSAAPKKSCLKPKA